MLVDRHMSQWDVHATRHHIVDADVEATFAALGTARLDDPLLRLLFDASRLPARLSDRLARWRAPSAARRTPPPSMGWRHDWILLDERPPHEAVSATLLKFGRHGMPHVQHVAPSSFGAFEEPGHAKLIVAFSLRPYGARRTVLTMDLRAAGTDAATKKRLHRASRFARPFADAMMDRVLGVIERKAEHAPAPSAEPAPPPSPPPGGTRERGRRAGGSRTREASARGDARDPIRSDRRA